jgi:ribosomal protein L37AE/L43A
METALGLPSDVVLKIFSFLDLMEGVDASVKNLSILLNYVKLNRAIVILGTTFGYALQICGRKLCITIKGGLILGSDRDTSLNAFWAQDTMSVFMSYSLNAGGMLSALVDFKRIKREHEKTGGCSDCLKAQRLRLKALGMSKCHTCMFTDIYRHPMRSDLTLFNINTLLQFVLTSRDIIMTSSESATCGVLCHGERTSTSNLFSLRVVGPFLPTDSIPEKTASPTIFSRAYSDSKEFLVNLMYFKDLIAAHESDDRRCPSCLGEEFPRLKAFGLPKCCVCTLSSALCLSLT